MTNPHPIYRTGDIVNAYQGKVPHRLNPFKVKNWTTVGGVQRLIYCKACEGIMFNDEDGKDNNDFVFSLVSTTTKEGQRRLAWKLKHTS